MWTEDPKVTPFRDGLKYALDNGYAGSLGNASAAVMGDFVVVDMFGEACTETRRPKRPRSAPQSAPNATIGSDCRCETSCHGWSAQHA